MNLNDLENISLKNEPSEALNKICCLNPMQSGEFKFCSEMKVHFRNIFEVLNFCFFSFKRKEEINKYSYNLTFKLNNNII